MLSTDPREDDIRWVRKSGLYCFPRIWQSMVAWPKNRRFHVWEACRYVLYPNGTSLLILSSLWPSSSHCAFLVQGTQSKSLRVRPDDRLAASCCQEEIKSKRLESIIEMSKEIKRRQFLEALRMRPWKNLMLHFWTGKSQLLDIVIPILCQTFKSSWNNNHTLKNAWNNYANSNVWV